MFVLWWVLTLVVSCVVMVLWLSVWSFVLVVTVSVLVWLCSSALQLCCSWFVLLRFRLDSVRVCWNTSLDCVSLFIVVRVVFSRVVVSGAVKFPLFALVQQCRLSTMVVFLCVRIQVVQVAVVPLLGLVNRGLGVVPRLPRRPARVVWNGRLGIVRFVVWVCVRKLAMKVLS